MAECLTEASIQSSKVTHFLLWVCAVAQLFRFSPNVHVHIGIIRISKTMNKFVLSGLFLSLFLKSTQLTWQNKKYQTMQRMKRNEMYNAMDKLKVMHRVHEWNFTGINFLAHQMQMLKDSVQFVFFPTMPYDTRYVHDLHTNTLYLWCGVCLQKVLHSNQIGIDASTSKNKQTAKIMCIHWIRK